MDGVDVETDDEAAREVVAPEQERAAVIDAEFEQTYVAFEERAEVLLVVAQVVRVRGLVGVVLGGVEGFLSRSHSGRRLAAGRVVKRLWPNGQTIFAARRGNPAATRRRARRGVRTRRRQHSSSSTLIVIVGQCAEGPRIAHT